MIESNCGAGIAGHDYMIHAFSSQEVHNFADELVNLSAVSVAIRAASGIAQIYKFK
jgi:hypothetical protein